MVLLSSQECKTKPPADPIAARRSRIHRPCRALLSRGVRETGAAFFCNEVKGVLSPDGFWFAPLSPDTGQINASATTIGEHRVAIARKNVKAFIEGAGLQYHSPHKFRHGHIHYGVARAKTIEDFKAVSMNVLRSSMEITDQFYSNLNDDEIKGRIGSLGKGGGKETNQETEELIRQFLSWKSKVGK